MDKKAREMVVLVQHGFCQYEDGIPYDPIARMLAYRATYRRVLIEYASDCKGSFPPIIEHAGAFYTLSREGSAGGTKEPVYEEAFVARDVVVEMFEVTEHYFPGTAPGESGHDPEEEAARQRAIDAQVKRAARKVHVPSDVKPGRVYRVVQTDNFGGDYPNESFEGPCMTHEECERVAELFNKVTGADRGGSRFYKTEHESYKLAPGFEP